MAKENKDSSFKDMPEGAEKGASFGRAQQYSKSRVSLGMFLVVIIAVIVGVLWHNQNRVSGFESEWQAVFLTNGQVYFGQVVSNNLAEVKLKDIYYLQVTQPLQQTEEGESRADMQNPQGGLQLVKLGSEVHGPTDVMMINREHVLFVEDLKSESNVVQAINNYKAEQQQ